MEEQKVREGGWAGGGRGREREGRSQEEPIPRGSRLSGEWWGPLCA